MAIQEIKKTSSTKTTGKVQKTKAKTQTKKPVFNTTNNNKSDLNITKSGWKNEFYTTIAKWNIRKYNWTAIKNTDDAINKSQEHLIDLIRYYEGDATNNYKAKMKYDDRNGVRTFGYGVVNLPKKIQNKYNISLPPKTEQEAYKAMIIYIDEVAKTDIINALNIGEKDKSAGQKLYDSLPASIKEALLDLAFNKGYSALTEAKGLKKALQNKDWPTVLQLLIYTTPNSQKVKGKNELAGLYRRSLSRVILAAKGLPKSAKIDAIVKNLYDASIKSAKKENVDSKALEEFEKIYKAYVNGNVPEKPQTNEAGGSNVTKTYRINQEKMGIFSIAKSMRPSSCGVIDATGLLKAIMAEIIKINNIKTDGNDENGYPKVGLQTRNTVLKLPTQIKFEGKTIKLNPPAEMEDVTPKPKSAEKKEINLAAKAQAAVQNNKNSKNLVKGTYTYTVDESFKGKGAYAIAKANYEKQDTNEITFSEFYKLFNEANSSKALNNIKVGDTVKVPLISGGKLPENAVIDTPKKIKIKKQEKEEEGNVITRFFKGVYNKIFSKQQKPEKTDSEDTELVYENDPNSVPFQNVLKEKNKKIIKYTNIVKTAGKSEKYSVYEITLNYKVKEFKTHPNETVWGISHRFGVDMEKFCKDNGIKDKSKIKAGQTVNIKKFGYKVEKGETLLSICKKFNLTPDILMQLNGIDEGETVDLEVGRMIELPGFLYKVKKGDTFESIAAKVGIAPSVLRNINGNKISVGEKIRVLYNNPDYDKTPEAVKTQIISGKKIEKIDMSGNDKILKSDKYKYLRYKTKVNNLVVANRAEFSPKGNGKLSGKTIILNAGHGYSQAGKDPGAVIEKDGLNHEWILNYDNVMRLIPKLQAQGARVIYIQGYKNLVQKALKQPENKGDLFISVHANIGKGDDTTRDRTQFYYREGVEKGKAREHSIAFAKIAEKIFDSKYKSEKYAEIGTCEKRSGVLKTPINNQKIPGIIWEVAFMDSKEGRRRLKDNTTMNNYMNLMVESINEYFRFVDYEKKQNTITRVRN